MGWSRPKLSRLCGPGRRRVRRPASGRTGWAKARTGPYRPHVRGEKEAKTAGDKRKGKETRTRKKELPDRGWGMGTAGEASAGLKFEGANDLE